MIIKAWRAYQQCLARYPLRTQGITSGCVLGVGDVLAQQLVEKKGLDGHNYARTARQSFFGVIFVGPVVITWYKLLERIYKGSGKLAPLCKVATDQALFAPFIVSCFISYVAFGNGRTVPEVKSQLKADFVPTLLNAYMVFPPVQLFNFYILPLYYRPVVINIVSVFWNTYLSWKTNNPTDQKVPVDGTKP
ncbi:mitochondrial inner membrane protein Mpv17-like [Apostichopus japonicus]|uniref:mitochondrial inner membrane protein Mpv17-like n=1 Tax=Stichopus japonicus TaxID=307972 RepID=UPI003AB6BA84